MVFSVRFFLFNMQTTKDDSEYLQDLLVYYHTVLQGSLARKSTTNLKHGKDNDYQGDLRT